MDGKDVEAIEQVRSETAAGDFLFQVAVGGGNHTHVHLGRSCAPQPLELLLLQHAQELDLHVGRQLPDFIQEDRAVVRELESSLLLLHRAGERAALVPEQLALGQARWQCGAIHLHHHAVPPATEVVNRPGRQLLAGPGLTKDEHCGVGVGNHPDGLEHPPHRRRLPDHLAVAPFDLDLLLQVDVLRLELFGPLAIGDVAGDEGDGRMTIDPHAEHARATLEPSLAREHLQRVLERLARARLERPLHEAKMRVGDLRRQDVVEPPALHLLRGAVEEVLARGENLDIAPFLIDDEDEVGQRVQDGRQPVLAPLEIRGARDDAILQLVGIALDASAELCLPNRDGQRAGDFLRNLDGRGIEAMLVE